MKYQLVYKILLLILNLKIILPAETEHLIERLSIRDIKDFSLYNPVPNFEAFRPNGLKISLSNIDGLQIFGIHANLNKPINIKETGEYHNDVMSSKNGFWTYYINDIELSIGDVLNYWVYLQMDGIGNQYDKKRYVVTNFTTNPEYLIHQPITEMKNSSGNCYCNDTIPQTTNIPDSHLQLMETTSSNCNEAHLKMLKNQIDSLENQFDSLSELVNELIKNLNIGTELILTGITNKDGKLNSLDIIRDLISNELDLFDLSDKVLRAEFINNTGILFKMPSAVEKKRILIRADKYLKKSKYQIIDIDIDNGSNKNEPNNGGVTDNPYFRTSTTRVSVTGNERMKTSTESSKTTTPKEINAEQSNHNDKRMTDAELSASGISDIYDVDFKLGSLLVKKRPSTELPLRT